MTTARSAEMTSPESKTRSWQMFNRIAPTYDLLNRMLSAGIDRGWRRSLYASLPPAPERLDLLDLATGTGDQLLSLMEADGGRRFRSATGLDPAELMLARARTKPGGRAENVHWIQGNACALPMAAESVDVITMSFGIRNVPEPAKCLAEIFRVLRPGGRALILEFALPRNAVVRATYLFYFRKVLPWIGGLVSGDRAAYHYLNQTVEEFPCGDAFLELMKNAGFRPTKFRELTFGIANLYSGDRP